jgi:uncharacterized protein YecE (DUF72 family)
MGGSSWSFPGWEGLVFAQAYPAPRLSQEGLAAYASHPLLRSVGLDRTFYAPLSVEQYRAYADQVPADFRFVVKAHERCTLAHFPWHERYGALRGQPNAAFLDAGYARDAVVGPLVEGMGTRLGLILFQFPPQDPSALGGVDPFIDRLYRFLRSLPPGPTYAVEVRNREMLTERFAKALEYADALPTLAGWSRLPSLREQAQLLRASERQTLFVRWMLRWDLDFEEAEGRYLPFNQLVDPDSDTRAEVVSLVEDALARGKSVFLTVGNNAEGCAPLTLQALAEALSSRTG